MFGKISLDSELHSAQRTPEFPLPFIVGCFLVVLQGRPVTEHCWTQGTGDDLACMCSPDVSVEAGPSGKFRVALVAFEIFLAGVGLHVAGQGLSVFKCGTALTAREGLARCGVQILVDRQVVFSGECFEAKMACVSEVWMGLKANQSLFIGVSV